VLGLAAAAGFFAPETGKPDHQGLAEPVTAERITAEPACVTGTPSGQHHTDPA
jgi:hypothetical protein